MSEDKSLLWQKWGAIGTCASAVVALISVSIYVWQALRANEALQASNVARAALETANAKVDVLQLKAENQSLVLSNTLAKVQLYGDIASAEGGDRFAYARALERLRELERSGAPEAETLLQKLRFSTRRFMGEVEGNPDLEHALLSYPSNGDNVEAMLRHEFVSQRLCALKIVLDLRLNEYVPGIFSAIEAEPDLNVVQMALHVVNATFEDNYLPNDPKPRHTFSLDECVLDYGKTRKCFDEIWSAHKDAILSRKPKEWRSRPDPPRGSLLYIFDPEKPAGDQAAP